MKGQHRAWIGTVKALIAVKTIWSRTMSFVKIEGMFVLDFGNGMESQMGSIDFR